MGWSGGVVERWSSSFGCGEQDVLQENLPWKRNCLTHSRRMSTMELSIAYCDLSVNLELLTSILSINRLRPVTGSISE